MIQITSIGRIMMKLLCSILVVALMLINIVYAEVVDDDLTLFQTVIGNNGLKFADITDDDIITREEMVDVIINITQIQKEEIYAIKRQSKLSQSIIEYTPFSDWKLEEDKEELVQRLYECEIIKGDGNNTFRPNDACTVEETITFIVRALGWAPLAESKEYGGFPEGYVKVAEEKGLIDEDDIIKEGNMNRIISEMIFNSLFIETMERDGTQWYHDFNYISAPCALERFHGLSYIYGYATKCENGIMINDDVFIGEVSNSELFANGYVFCIYDANNNGTGQNMILCLEISESVFGDKT